jgi:hypothetical protein
MQFTRASSLSFGVQFERRLTVSSTTEIEKIYDRFTYGPAMKEPMENYEEYLLPIIAPPAKITTAVAA